MDEKITLIAAGTEINFSGGDEEYLRKLVNEFNQDVSKIQLSHTKATKLEAVIMCALNYLDDKKKLEGKK
ncbi:MAG: cell division protein ZapA [Clostridia bacterium]|nr:cell division protein ZapA [Clostridia bacterium]